MDLEHSSLRVEEQGAVLQAFYEALNREIHLLEKHPNLLWQQLYNRLQWVDCDKQEMPITKIIGQQFLSRTCTNTKPWLHNRCKIKESEYSVHVLGHFWQVKSCAFSPDGSTLVSKCAQERHDSDNLLILWDVKTGQRIDELCKDINSYTFSKDGRTLASAGYDNSVRLWDTHTGAEIISLKGINSYTFSKDGRTFASTGNDNTVRLWDTHTGAEMMSLEGHADAVNACVFSPDGCTLASASNDKTVRLWDAYTGAQITVIEGHTEEIYSCAFSPDGCTLVSKSKDKTVRLWDIRDNRYKNIEIHRYVSRIVFSPNWKIMVINGAVFSDGHKRADLHGKAATFSPDGRILITLNNNFKELRLWDVSKIIENSILNEKTLHFYPDEARQNRQNANLRTAIADAEIAVIKSKNDLYSFCFSPDSRILAFKQNRNLWLWDVRTCSKIAVLEGHFGAITDFAFSPDENLLATSSNDKFVRFWDIRKAIGIDPASINQEVHQKKGGVCNVTEFSSTKGHTGIVNSCTFSPDSRIIASGSYDKTIRLWESNTGSQLRILNGHNHITNCIFSPDGHTLASASNNDNSLYLWDTHTGVEIAVLTDETRRLSGITSCAFSPNGRILAFGDRHGKIQLWNAIEDREMGVLNGHYWDINSIVFSCDSNVIASASKDKTIILWDVHKRKKIVVLKGHQGPVTSCVFSPDQTLLASASGDNTFRLWDAIKKRQIHEGVLYECPQGKDKTIWLRGVQQVWSCAFSPDGHILAVTNEDKIILWNPYTQKKIGTLQGHVQWINSVSFAPDGKSLVSAGNDHMIHLWEIQTGISIFFPCNGPSKVCNFNTSGDMLIAGDESGSLYILKRYGYELEPIIVTACIRKHLWKQELFLRCPACQKEHSMKEEQLGHEMTCPTPDCGLRLKINPFTIKIK
jgi:WD40 repeat protein